MCIRRLRRSWGECQVFLKRLDLTLSSDVKIRLENIPPGSPVNTEKNISVDTSTARTRGGCC